MPPPEPARSERPGPPGVGLWPGVVAAGLGFAAVGLELVLALLRLGSLWAGLAFMTLPYLVMVGWAIVASRRWGTGSIARDFGFRIRWIDLPIAIGGVVVAFLLRFVLSIVVTLIAGPPRGRPTNLPVSSIEWANVVIDVVAVLVAPVVEELVFRGMLLPGVRDAIAGRAPSASRITGSTVAAIVISAVVFMLLHVPQALGGTSIGVLIVTPLGLGLVNGVLVVLTRRLGAPILTHAISNGIALALVTLVHLG